MLRITTVGMTAVPNSGENRVPLEDWLGKSFRVEVALPRKTLGIPILDNEIAPFGSLRNERPS